MTATTTTTTWDEETNGNSSKVLNLKRLTISLFVVSVTKINDKKHSRDDLQK